MRASFRTFIITGFLSIALGAAQAADKPVLRSEVGKPLQEAQTALQGKDYKTALGKIDEAGRIDSLTPYEAYIVERMRAIAATGAGDMSLALKSYEAALASDQMPEGDKLQAFDAAAKLAYAEKNYGKAADYIGKYRNAGGDSAQTLSLLPQALYLSNDLASAQKELSALIAKTEKAGQTPTDVQLQLLASCASKQGDNAGYLVSLQKLVRYYPKESYWKDLILRTAGKPGFSEQLTLDMYRLMKATGTLDKANDYMEAAQYALKAGFPGEADQYVQLGYAQNLLGQGPDADRHQRLKVMVAQKIKEDRKLLAEGEKAAAAQAAGDALVATGLNYVGYGQYDKGIALMQQGIAKGGLKKPDEAKLHLGYAQMLAGRAADAKGSLKLITGENSVADIAQLWTLVKQPGEPATYRAAGQRDMSSP
ncbi:tetratricopeptide repeat protein [Solimonas soli]|uniref:tetratricopeptide repeat protein n=1 Tax=Solimonas soli TaxID=413479 RepID=UPI0006888BF8|nr:hypothetical protein [Solimonas soli]